jgi:uncharacterized protein YjbI with pentapeptide repeats
MLVGIDVERFRARDSVLVDCDLAGALLEDVNLNVVTLERCRLTGAVLAGARLRKVRFVDCVLDDVNLRGVIGEDVVFEGCSLRSADLAAARMPGARLLRCDLTGIEVSNVDLQGASLHGSTLADVRGATSLRGVRIDPTQLLPLALPVLAAQGVTVTDDPDT